MRWLGCGCAARGITVPDNDAARIDASCAGGAKTAPAAGRQGLRSGIWRLGSESNRRTRLCRPLHNHSATQPKREKQGEDESSPFASGAGNEARTRDLNLGKVALYQLSYARVTASF